jgi:hypothetical protein
MSEIFNLWPNIVSLSKYDGDLTKVKEKILNGNQKIKAVDQSTTVNGVQPAWLVSPWSWDEPFWLDIKTFINQQLRDYKSTVYPTADQTDPIVKRAWTVTYDEGGYQQPHCHAHMDLSVLFVVQHNPSGELIFTNPAIQSSYTNFQPYSQTFKLESGMLLIWPAWILHYSLPTIAGDQKIVISLDALLTKP